MHGSIYMRAFTETNSIAFIYLAKGSPILKKKLFELGLTPILGGKVAPCQAHLLRAQTPAVSGASSEVLQAGLQLSSCSVLTASC